MYLGIRVGRIEALFNMTFLIIVFVTMQDCWEDGEIAWGCLFAAIYLTGIIILPTWQPWLAPIIERGARRISRPSRK